MIDARDRLWIAVKKLLLRKRWMLFTMFSLSLGLAVFTATTSLIEGARSTFMNTLYLSSRRTPPDHIRIEARDPKAPRTEGAKDRRITSADISRISTLPGVEAAGAMQVVTPVRLSLELETAQPLSVLIGMEDAFLQRFMPAGRKLWEVPDLVPVVMSRFVLMSQYDEAKTRFRVRRGLADSEFVGKDVEVWVGANVVDAMFREDYKDGKKKHLRTTREERASRRAEQYRSMRNRYDMNIYQRALKLKGRIVAVVDFEHCLIPMSVARDAASWLKSRELLAGPRFDAPKPEPGYRVVYALAKSPAELESASASIKAAGFFPTHRDAMRKDAIEEWNSGVRVVRYIFYGIGGLMFGISCLFVWSTMSKVIADSRREIGVFRALGATRRDVLSIFMLQAFVMGVGGAVMGVGGGFGLAALVSKGVLYMAELEDTVWDVEHLGFDSEDVLPKALYSFDPYTVGLMVLGAMIASIVAGLIPAWRAANMDPVAALQRRD